MPREQKRNVCNCCENSAPRMSSSKPAKKRCVQKQNEVLSEQQPVFNIVKEPVKPSVELSLVPVNQSKSVAMSKVLACQMEAVNEDIVFQSAGHSTRRIKCCARRTVRGLGTSHTFIKDVTYTFASSKVGYIGQELLPFHTRSDLLNRSSSASKTQQKTPSISDTDEKPTSSVPKCGIFHKPNISNKKSMPLDTSDSEFNVRSNKAFNMSEDSDSSDSYSISNGNRRKSSSGSQNGAFDKPNISNTKRMPWDVSDSESNDGSNKAFNGSQDNDSSDSDSVSDHNRRYTSSGPGSGTFNMPNISYKKRMPWDVSDSESNDRSNKAFNSSEDSDSSDSDSVSDHIRRSTSDSGSRNNVSGGNSDRESWTHDSRREYNSDQGNKGWTDSDFSNKSSDTSQHYNRNRATRNDNNLSGVPSDLRDSYSDIPNNCGTENREKCEKHNRWQWCACRWSPCLSEWRPLPQTCPRKMKELMEAFSLNSSDKEEYAILKEVKYEDLGCSPCIYLYNNNQMTICSRQLQNVRLDRTFNLDVCYVTAFVFRNFNFINKQSYNKEKQYGPLMTGPVMLHFDKAFETYVRFFKTVQREASIVIKPVDPEVSDLLNDIYIAKPMRKVFGSSMSLTSTHHVPVSLRNQLRKDVSCFSPVSTALISVFDRLDWERLQTKLSLFLGKRSEYTLRPRAKEYLKKWENDTFDVKLHAFDRLEAE